MVETSVVATTVLIEDGAVLCSKCRGRIASSAIPPTPCMAYLAGLAVGYEIRGHRCATVDEKGVCRACGKDTPISVNTQDDCRAHARQNADNTGQPLLGVI